MAKPVARLVLEPRHFASRVSGLSSHVLAVVLATTSTTRDATWKCLSAEIAAADSPADESKLVDGWTGSTQSLVLLLMSMNPGTQFTDLRLAAASHDDVAQLMPTSVEPHCFDDMGPALLEVRAMDTSFIEIVAPQRDTLELIASVLPGRIELKTSRIQHRH